MDSTAEEDARDAKRARLTPPAGDVVDLISGLDDDVLIRVLALVADASDAVRTGALSRRWLGLWTRVHALRFGYRPTLPKAASGAEHCAALERYVSFVNGVLARRARSCCAIETLSISYTTTTNTARKLEQLMPASAGAAQDWIRYAFLHRVTSLVVDMLGQDMPPERGYGFQYNFVDDLVVRRDEDDDDRTPLVIVDDDLPVPERLETMHLGLGGARLRLPTTMKFASLVDLSFERIKLAPGGAQLLAHLVSSANFPCLRKLRMSKLRLPSSDEEMRLDADVLSDLWVEDVKVRSLELRTPSLRVLHIDFCRHELLRVSAPRLEELTFFPLGQRPSRLEVDGGLTHVRSLKLLLMARRPNNSSETDKNSTNVLLLKHCSSVICLDVNLNDDEEDWEEDTDMIASNIPYFPHVTSLTVNVSNAFERHDFGVGVAILLARFKNVRHLSLHLPFFHGLSYDIRDGLDLECDHPDHWTSHEISMAHLQVAELTGLTGTDCEVLFMKAVLRSARGLRKVSISFTECGQYVGKMDSQHEANMDAYVLFKKRTMDAFESMLHDEGMRTSYREGFMLNTCRDL